MTTSIISWTIEYISSKSIGNFMAQEMTDSSKYMWFGILFLSLYSLPLPSFTHTMVYICEHGKWNPLPVRHDWKALPDTIHHYFLHNANIYSPGIVLPVLLAFVSLQYAEFSHAKTTRFFPVHLPPSHHALSLPKPNQPLPVPQFLQAIPLPPSLSFSK